MTVLKSGASGRVSDGTLPDASSTGNRTPVGGVPADVSGLQGIISTDGGDSGVPGHGLQRGG